MTTETEEIIALLERKAARNETGSPYVLGELLHEARLFRRAAELVREKDALEARGAEAADALFPIADQIDQLEAERCRLREALREAIDTINACAAMPVDTGHLEQTLAQVCVDASAARPRQHNRRLT